MKSRARIIAEGCCFFVISGGTPFIPLLSTDAPLTARAVALAMVTSLVGAATAMKAFFTQSQHDTP